VSCERVDELLPAACHVVDQYATDEIVNPSGVDEVALGASDKLW
jgi:hypothetical protein